MEKQYTKRVTKKELEQNIQELKDEVKKMYVELNVMKEAFNFLGGYEAVQEKLAEKAKQKQAAGPSLSWKPLSRMQEKRLAKEKGKILKKEAEMIDKGYLLGKFENKKDEINAKINLRSLPLEERKKLVEEAVKKEKEAKKLARIQKWENRLNNVKATVYASKKMVAKKVIEPMVSTVYAGSKYINNHFIKPGVETIRQLKNEMVKSLGNKYKQVKTFVNKMNNGLKNYVLKHMLDDKRQEEVNPSWNKILERTSTQVKGNLKKNWEEFLQYKEEYREKSKKEKRREKYEEKQKENEIEL